MGGTKIRLVAAAAMVLALSVALASPVLGAKRKKPAGGGFQIDIITCPDGSQPPPGATSTADCQQGTQQLPPPKKKKPAAPSRPGQELHEVDLNTGDKKISGAGGEELDLNLKARDAEGNIVDAAPVEPIGTGASGGALPPVSTNGGALPGAGSPFDYVSTDQALASFEVPPFLLPIYVSAGRAYDIPWNVLAAINRHETDFGRLGACVVSSAGAQGWMQFIPSTWAQYGVDASGDGAADPCNPVDAIYAAARYLHACSDDLREAIFCYNHADWYVDMVLRTASVYGSLPGGLVTETGSLAYGHFPVRGEVSYGDDFRQAELAGQTPTGLSMQPSGSASAVATQSATVTRVLLSPELARAFRRDPGRAAAGPSPKPAAPAAQSGAAPARTGGPVAPPAAPETSAQPEQAHPEDSGEFGWLVPLSKDLNALTGLASGDLAARAEPPAEPRVIVGGGTWTSDAPATPVATAPTAAATATDAAPAPAGAAPAAKPAADKQADATQLAAATDSAGKATATGTEIQPGANGLPDGYEVAKVDGVGVELTDPVGNHYRYEGLEKLSPELRPGVEVEGRDVLGPLRDGKPMVFSLTAAGGAPVDPRPMVDGYRLQEATNYFHAVEPIGGNPFLPDSETIAAGIVSGDQAQLAQRVLNDPGISIYDCGRGDIQQGIVDKRILGALLYLRSAGMTLTVTSLRCGHGYYTAGGSVSAHSYGAAVDIAAFNGQPVIGNQGPGSLTEQAIKLLMQLQGPARPAQLISLMSFGGPSFALGDHDDHLHVGYSFSTALDLGQSGDGLAPPVFGGAGAVSGQGLTKPQKGAEAQKHEQALSETLGKIENPEVPGRASPGAPRVRGEGERRSEVGAAAHAEDHAGNPIDLHPTSSGAEMIAVDVPEGNADEAYGLGVVDGAPHGWSEHQIVALSYRDGAWTVIGPPVDAKGNVVNPKLTELATAPGGRGYAVGEHGAAVELRGDAPPRLLSSRVKGNLTDVDVASGGTGYAVGAQAGVVAFSGGRANPENAGSQTSPSAVTSGGAVTLMAGSGAAGRPALLQRAGNGSWEDVPVELRLAPGSSVSVESLAAHGGEIWIGGSLADSAGTPLKVPFVAHRGSGGGWETYCSINPALSVVEELGTPTAGPCQRGLPTSTPGASVSGIEVGGDGPIAAAGDVLIPLDDSHQRATAAFGPIQDLAVGPSHSEGFALGPHGSLVRIGPEAADAQTKVQDLPLGNASPVLVSAAAEDQVIALGDGRAARFGEGGWELTEPTGIAVRDVAWTGETAWAIDELGVPLELTDSGWSAPGEDDDQQELREKLAGTLGGNPLSPPESGAGDGLRALAFSSPGAGFAVGDGVIGSYGAGVGWTYNATDAALMDVAASEDRAVAVGSEGALLELQTDGWQQSAMASELAKGADLTAAAAVDDGTMLAAGGGVVLAREPDAEDWSAVELPPLGVEVRRLAGIRRGDGTLAVFALADAGGQLVALRGEHGSWSPIGVEGVTVSDLSAVPGTDSVLLSGDRSGKAVTVKVDTDSGVRGGNNGESDGGE